LNLISAKNLPRLLAVMLAAAAAPAHADAYCAGTVLEHLVYNDGTFMIRSSWRNDWTHLCSMQAPWKGVSTESCYTWFGLVTAARTHNKPIGIYYVGNFECATLATYGSAPTALYLRMTE